MADVVDYAATLQEADLENRLADQRAMAARSRRPAPQGYCLNPRCAADLDGDRLFCGPKCAFDYERIKKNG